jgi:superfamily II DNA helicase RecQ
VAWGVYQIVYAGPEMTSPNNNAIWRVLDDEKSAFRRSLKVVVVDEVHCVHAWGAPAEDGKPPFRKEYANIGGL